MYLTISYIVYIWMCCILDKVARNRMMECRGRIYLNLLLGNHISIISIIKGARTSASKVVSITV